MGLWRKVGRERERVGHHRVSIEWRRCDDRKRDAGAGAGSWGFRGAHSESVSERRPNERANTDMEGPSVVGHADSAGLFMIGGSRGQR